MKLRKCPNCKSKIKGLAIVCPTCGKRFTCDCGKELDDNKYNKCPICRAEASEKRKEVAKKVGIAAGGIATAILTVVTIVNKTNKKSK